MSSSLKLCDLPRCFQGIVPAVIATSDANGVPNVAYLSHVYLVDETHVALSRQFFNKTQRNLEQNPRACVEMIDPLTFQGYRLRLTFLRTERNGPLFDSMSLRIDAIASHTGMTGVFKLIGADVFEVRSIERAAGFLSDVPIDPEDRATLEGHRTEVRGLQWISERINRAADLESLLTAVLEALDEYFHFRHTIFLLHDEAAGKLVTLASRGYGYSGVGAEVVMGQGVIGTVAHERRVLQFKNFHSGLNYGRAARREFAGVCDEVPLPGLPNPQSVLAIPLLVGDRLIGVLAAEDADPMKFDEWHEAYLGIIGNQIALGVHRMSDDEGSSIAPRRPKPAESSRLVPDQSRTRTLIYYRNDDAIFVDGEYLIRNIPARILWKLLAEQKRTGRTDFTNREVRLDETLGLPPVKDNFESRLILLRHRLEEKCPDVRLVSTGRGRFSLQTRTAIEMVER